MQVLVLDARPRSLEGELARIAAAGAVVGVEVTGPPALTAACAVNVDPQHQPGGDPSLAAISVIADMVRDQTWDQPRGGAYATVRPDRDAFGAIGVAEFATPRQLWDADVTGRVQRIADADVSAPRTPGPRDPGVGEVDAFAALGAAVADWKLSPVRRVELTWEWLTTGEFPGWEGYAAQVATLRADVERLASEVTLAHGGRVAAIVTPSPMGVVAGYRNADIVVALNPAFRWPQGHTTRKYTVCQQPGAGLDVAALAAELNDGQPGWGGIVGATCGSPQGEEPQIDLDELVELVGKHLA